MEQAFELLRECTARHAAQRVLFVNGRGHRDFAGDGIDYIQPLYPYAKNIAEEHIITTIQSAQGYDAVWILIPKSVAEAQYYMACGVRALKQGGALFMAAENTANGKRLKGWCETLGLSAEIISGHKSKCACVKRISGLNAEVLNSWADAGAGQRNTDGFMSQPGLFSWDRKDAASTLLLDTLEQPVRGDIADFGCGYGYLSASIDRKYIKSLSGLDADRRALICYADNVAGARTLWCDLSVPYDAPQAYDVILMNPPFHTGKQQDNALGGAFIKNAARNLKKGGTLWIVANTHLPYENVLEAHFSSFEIKAQEKGFKVIRAERL